MGGDEEAPEQAAAPQGGVTAGVGNYKVHIAQKQLPVVGTLFSGMVFLIAICVDGRGTKYWEYGVALGSVTMFFSIVGLVLTIAMKDNDGVGKIGMINSNFLFLWCFVGACIMTFAPGPYQETSNGYFAAWGMAAFSTMSVGVTANQLSKSVSGMGSLLGLVASSVIVIIATVDFAKKGSGYRNEAIYALVLACVTVVVAGALGFKNRGGDGGKDMIGFVILGLFALCWIVEACLVTFRGPFKGTGNGYFGSWCGAVTSVFAAMGALQG